MKQTLDLPDDLADRLPSSEDQLRRILELGLEAVEDDNDLPDSAEELPATWKADLAVLMSQRSRTSASEQPSIEELIAYRQGEIGTPEEEVFLERLTRHPESVRDLVDLIEFEDEEIRSPKQARETDEALQKFRALVRADSPQRSRSRWVAVAAMLITVLGASTTLWVLGPRPQTSVPRYAAIFDVAANRGARPFPVSEGTQEVLLIFPIDAYLGSEHGKLSIFSVEGELVYQETFQRSRDQWSRLYLSIPSDRLSPGTYLLEITSEGQPKIQEYRLTIEASSP